MCSSRRAAGFDSAYYRMWALEGVSSAQLALGHRTEAFEALAQAHEGEDDVVIIADLPDNVAVSAVSLGVSATGFVRTRTTALLTVEEVDKALGTSINYRKPGG